MVDKFSLGYRDVVKVGSRSWQMLGVPATGAVWEYALKPTTRATGKKLVDIQMPHRLTICEAAGPLSAQNRQYLDQSFRKVQATEGIPIEPSEADRLVSGNKGGDSWILPEQQPHGTKRPTARNPQGHREMHLSISSNQQGTSTKSLVKNSPTSSIKINS